MTKLFDEYQAAQTELAREVTDGLAVTMGALDLTRVDASAPGWVAAATSVVQRGHRKGVQLGTQYAEQFSDEGLISGRFRVNPATADVNAIAASLTVLGPHRAKHLMSRGADFETVARTILAGVAGAGTRHAVGGMRETVRKTYTRVRRIAKSGCCGFCAMLATREYWIESGTDAATSAAGVVVGRNKGRTRGNQRIGEKFHDHCKCEVVPISDGLQPDGYEDRLELFEDAYYEARERASEMDGGANARNVISEMNRLQREGWF